MTQIYFSEGSHFFLPRCFVQASGDLDNLEKFSLFPYLSSHPKGTQRSVIRISWNVSSVIFKVEPTEKQA